MSYGITEPLTTIFTPPATCTSYTYEASYYNNKPGGLLIQNAVQGDLDTSCFPSGFDQYGRAFHGSFYFSPGACPGGYSTAAAYNGQTTTAVCCPSSYSFLQQFSSLNYKSSSVEFEGCISTFPAGSKTTVPGISGANLLNTTVVTGPITLWAQPISIAFQQADLTYFTTSSSMPTSTAATTQQTASASTATPTSTTSAAATTSAAVTSQGLSGGAIAGIAIGCAALIGLLIGAALFFRRRSNRSSNTDELPHYGDAKIAPEEGMAGGAPVVEADGAPYAELPSGQTNWQHPVYQEVPGDDVAYEMPAQSSVRAEKISTIPR